MHLIVIFYVKCETFVYNFTEVTSYGHLLSLRHNGAEEYGGPLFWAHYSYLGLDPGNLEDQYANYWEHNVDHTLINRAHCIENPNGYKGYGENCRILLYRA